MRELEKIRLLLSEKLTLYPVLTGTLFLINELKNYAVFYSFKENVSLILIVGTFTLLVDFLSRKLIKEKIKAALIATLFIIINLFYQDISLAITGHKLLISFDNLSTLSHPEVFIIPTVVIVWLAFTFLVLRTKRILSRLNLYLNVLIIAFIFVEITQWLIVSIPQIQLADNEPFPVNEDLLPEQRPDIYYIILDAYTSNESLKKYWKYDNYRFEDSLKQLGFQIAPKSKVDYTSTPYCLASYLNSSTLIIDSTKSYTTRNLIQLIRNNRLSDWLSSNKYRCFNFSIFDAFEKRKYYNFFTNNHFLGRTIWFTNFLKLYHYINTSSFIARTNLKIFRKINHLAKKEHDQPIFTYAHVMMPHNPYTFNEKGKPYNTTDSLTNKQKYLGQLIFTNSLTLETINLILSSSRAKPIIIIQGDHGYRNLEDTTLIEKTHEAHTIFYACYSSYGSIVPDTLNPKNTFKEIIEKINHQQ